MNSQQISQKKHEFSILLFHSIQIQSYSFCYLLNWYAFFNCFYWCYFWPSSTFFCFLNLNQLTTHSFWWINCSLLNTIKSLRITIPLSLFTKKKKTIPLSSHQHGTFLFLSISFSFSTSFFYLEPSHLKLFRQWQSVNNDLKVLPLA